MISKYIDKAMRKATYELIEDGTFWGEIQGFPGVWGNGKTVEECRGDLKDALEGWLILGLWEHDETIPVLGKLSLIPRRVKLPRERGSATPPRNRKAS